MTEAQAEAPPSVWTHPIPAREALRRLRDVQKAGSGVPAYTRWVNRGLARYVVAGAQRLGLGPNALSALSFVISMTGVACLLTLGRSTPMFGGVASAVLLAVGYVLDSADGQLARLTGRPSLAGEWLDHTLDAVRLPMVHLGVLAAGVMLGRDWLAVAAGVFSVAASAHFLSQNLGGLLRDGAAGERVQVRPGQSWLLLPTDPGVLCWLFLLWGVPAAFTTAYGALLALNLAHVALSTRRRWRELAAIDRERSDR